MLYQKRVRSKVSFSTKTTIFSSPPKGLQWAPTHYKGERQPRPLGAWQQDQVPEPDKKCHGFGNKNRLMNVTVDMCYSKMTNSCLDVDLLPYHLAYGEPTSSTASICHHPDNKEILHSNVLSLTTWLLESSALTSLARLTFAIKEIQTLTPHKQKKEFFWLLLQPFQWKYE